MNRQMRRSLRKLIKAASTDTAAAALSAATNPTGLSPSSDPLFDTPIIKTLFAEAPQQDLPPNPLAPTAPSQQPPPPQQPPLFPLSQLAETPSDLINWLWPGRIPFGALILLEGDHNAAKSLLALTIAACVTRGLPLPAITANKVPSCSSPHRQPLHRRPPPPRSRWRQPLPRLHPQSRPRPPTKPLPPHRARHFAPLRPSPAQATN